MTPLQDFSTKMLEQFGTAAVSFILKLVIALIILLIGFRLVKYIIKLSRKMFEKADMDATLKGFLLSFINIGLRAVVVFIAVTELGIAASSIIAMVTSAMFAIGLSLQGSLANIAGGVVLLFVKPFQAGDYIVDESTGQEGYVKSMGILYTRLLTLDNQTVMIPNGNLANATITNRTYQSKRMEEILVGIEYSEDIDRVRKVMESVAIDDPACLEGEPVNVYVKEFQDSSILMMLRYWVATENYWTSRWWSLEEVKKRFDREGITIPFNQLDVNIRK